MTDLDRSTQIDKGGLEQGPLDGAADEGEAGTVDERSAESEQMSRAEPVAARSDPADRMRPKTGDSNERGPETEIWAGRTCWKHFSGRIALWALANVAVAVLLSILSSTVEAFTGGHVFWIVVVLVLLSGGWVLGRIAVGILGCHYRLTSERLFIERGILSRTTDQTELIRVDDVRMHCSLIDRIFDMGTVEVTSTDETDGKLLIKGISEPEKVAEAIRSRMRTLRKGSLFVENL